MVDAPFTMSMPQSSKLPDFPGPQAGGGAGLTRLTLAYAPAGQRGGAESLLAFDSRLAGVARAAKEPMIAQLKLAWWRERIAALGAEAGRGEPLLRTLAGLAGEGAIAAEPLAAVVDGWERLLVEAPVSEEQWQAFAQERGALFAALLPDGAALLPLGRCWALWEASLAASEPEIAAAAWQAGRALDRPAPVAHARGARPLVALGLFAAGELARAPWPRPPQGLGAFARLVRHGLTGR